MKKINLTTVLAVVFTISLSITSYSQQNNEPGKMKMDHSKMHMKHSKMKMSHSEGNMMQPKTSNAQFNDANLNKAYMHYIMINTALTKSNPAKVKMMSKMLVDILNNYGKAQESAAVASKLAQDVDLKEQRKLFAELTISMDPLFKENITEGNVYKNFCPMANGSGAYWFSNSEKIVNPYMGEKSAMSSCGSVKETYKSI